MSKRTQYQIPAPALNLSRYGTRSEDNLRSYDSSIRAILPKVNITDSADLVGVYKLLDKTSDILHGTHKEDGKSVSKKWSQRSDLLQKTKVELVELLEKAYASHTIDALTAKNVLQIFDDKIDIKTAYNTYVRRTGQLESIKPIKDYVRKHSNHYLSLISGEKSSGTRNYSAKTTATSKRTLKEIEQTRSKNRSLAALLAASKLTVEANEVSTQAAIAEAAEYRTQLDTTSEQLSQATTRVETLASENAASKTTIGSLEDKVAQGITAAEAGKKYISGIEQENRAYATQVSTLTQRLTDAEKREATLRIDFARLDLEKGTLADRLATADTKYDNDMARKNRQLSDKNIEISQAKDDLSNAQNGRFVKGVVAFGAGLLLGVLTTYLPGCDEDNKFVSKKYTTHTIVQPATPANAIVMPTTPAPYVSDISPLDFQLKHYMPALEAEVPAMADEEFGSNDPRYNVPAIEETVSTSPNVAVSPAVKVSPAKTDMNLKLSESSRARFHTLESRLNGTIVHQVSENEIAFGNTTYFAKKYKALDQNNLSQGANFDTAQVDHANDKFSERTSARNMKQLAEDLSPLRNSIQNYKIKRADYQLMLELVGQEGLTYEQVKLLHDASQITSRTAKRKVLGVSIPFTHTTPGRTASVGAK